MDFEDYSKEDLEEKIKIVNYVIEYLNIKLKEDNLTEEERECYKKDLEKVSEVKNLYLFMDFMDNLEL